MISMNRMSAIVVSLKQTVFAIMFLMSETTTESELGTRGQIFSVCLMIIDFLQVICAITDCPRIALTEPAVYYLLPEVLMRFIFRCCAPPCP
jgi:hypothetical protein